MKTNSNIIAFKHPALQRGLKTKLNSKFTKYIRHAGKPKPSSRAEFAGYCHA